MLFYFENKKDIESEKKWTHNNGVYQLNPSILERYEFCGCHTLDKISTHKPNISLQHSFHSSNPKVTKKRTLRVRLVWVCGNWVVAFMVIKCVCLVGT